MTRRYHLRNDTQMIEWPFTAAGLQQAREFRRTNPAFKRRKIRDVIQALPDNVVVGRVYLIGGREPAAVPPELAKLGFEVVSKNPKAKQLKGIWAYREGSLKVDTRGLRQT